MALSLGCSAALNTIEEVGRGETGDGRVSLQGMRGARTIGTEWRRNPLRRKATMDSMGKLMGTCSRVLART